jgi:hypothetical protein
MESFHESMAEYRKQLGRGDIQQAYRGLMEYIMGLRTRFKNQYPDYFVSGSLYAGYMDMTYFSFIPKSLQERKLKTAIVFVHQTGTFEVWLAGYNKQVQSRYWQLFRESGWDKYHLVPTTKGVDAIIDHVLVDDPDFSDLDVLTRQIETGTLDFIKSIETFLANQEN